jgi:hypothetical protein
VSSIYLILVRTPLLCVWCSILALGTPLTDLTDPIFCLGNFVRPTSVVGISMLPAATDS